MLKSTSKCGVETDKKPAGMSRKRPSPDGATPASGAALEIAMRRRDISRKRRISALHMIKGERTQGKPLRYAPE
jgi:hypothetical protein